MKVFVTTDTHFAHTALVEKHKCRPSDFETQIAMNWIDTVSNDDLVIHLGDIAVGATNRWYAIIPGLPGRKILTLGNHDGKSLQWYMEHGFDFACRKFYWKMYGLKILFSHVPRHDDTFDINIHGHLHRGTHHLDVVTDDRHQLLSLEETGYRPVLLKTLVETWQQKAVKRRQKAAEFFEANPVPVV